MRPFIRPRPVTDAAVRLIVLHHAGGSAMVYHPLARHLPPDWDVLLLDLPGRGSRHAEAPGREMSAVVDAAIRDLHDHTDTPYVLFGHSMGAVVAVEAARRLSGVDRPPLWVGVSGRSAPSVVSPGPRRLFALDDDELLTILVGLGGMPGQTEQLPPEFRQMFLRTVRADLEAVDSYLPALDRLPLPCPLTAFGGLTDPWAPAVTLSGWEHETSAYLRQCFFPGGHFYFLDAGFAALAREIRTEVHSVLRRVPTPSGAH